MANMEGTLAPPAERGEKEFSGKRLNFNVSEKAYNDLNTLAKKTQRTMTEVIRLGVGLAKIALEANMAGQKLVIANSAGEPIKEIVLPG